MLTVIPLLYAGRRQSSVPRVAALIALLSAVVATPLSAQVPAACGVSGSAGVAVPSEEVTVREPVMSEDRVVREEFTTGLALGLDADCPLGGPWRALAGVERLDLEDAVFWHFTAGIGARTEVADHVVLSGRVRGGWRHAVDDRPPIQPVPVDFRDVLVVGDDGPVGGAGVELAYRVGPAVELFTRASWRVGWLDREIIDFEEGSERTETETVHAFPITGGVTLRF